MVNGWRSVILGKLLERIKNEISIEDGELYKQVTVRLWNKGVVLRGQQLGSEIKTKRQFMIRAGQLILSRIDVRNGAIGICPSELDGAIISNDFWAYDINHQLICPEFLALYMKTPGFIDDANRTSSGTTHRVRSEEGAFLRIEIPLPPLTEQRRIITRIEVLAERVAVARSLRREANEKSKLLISSRTFDVFSCLKQKFPIKTFGSFSPHVSSGPRYWRDRYSEAGARFYRAQDIGPNGNILQVTKVYVRPPDSEEGKTAFLAVGDLMIVITGATVGRVTVFTEDLEPGYVSQHVSICRLPIDKILPRYALWWLLGPDGQEQLLGQRYGQGKPGLNLTNIRSIVMPIPPLEEQKRIVAYLDQLHTQVSALRATQAESQRELDALMPSVLDRAFKGEL